MTERAIPIIVFEHPDENLARKFLRKWTGDSSLEEVNLREVLDWEYYMERLAGTIQKIVTIPAAL